MNEFRPTFVFDGDCGICRTWVDYWRQLTGDRVAYRPYQEAAGDLPTIPARDFKRAVQLIEPDGQILSGAAATFRLLSFAPARGGWWWLYRKVRAFAPTERVGLLHSCRGDVACLPARRTSGGPFARARALRPRRLAVPARPRSHLCRRVRLAGAADPRPCRRRRYPAARRIPRSGARGLGTCRLLAPADAILAEHQRCRADDRGRHRHRPRPARHLRHRAALGACRPVRPLLVVRLRRAAVHELPVGHAAGGSRLPGDFPHDRHRASSSGSTASCCSAFCSSPGSSSSPRAMRPGSNSRRSTITSGRSRCPRRSPTTRRSCRIGCSPAATAAALIIELVAVALIFLPRRPRMLAAALVIAFQIAIIAHRQL